MVLNRLFDHGHDDYSCELMMVNGELMVMMVANEGFMTVHSWSAL